MDFTSDGVQNCEIKNKRLEMIVTSFQDFKLREKQISQSFSSCKLINSLRNGTKVHRLKQNMMSEKSVFCEACSPEIMSYSFPVSGFLVSQFCTPPEVKLHAFGTSKHGEGKSLSKHFFATLISTLGKFNPANKKSVIYTLSLIVPLENL